MVLVGRIRNSETHDSGWLLSWKRCWGIHHSNEAGTRVIQFGPLILEIWG